MFALAAIANAILALIAAGSGVGKLKGVQLIVENLSKVNVPPSWFPLLAAAELAGAAGLIIGLWVPAIGIAAGIALILYFVGAIIAHLRANDRDLARPGVILVLATAATALRAVTAW